MFPPSLGCATLASPVLYVFFGPDSFSRGEAVAAVKAELDREGDLAANTLVLDGSRTTAEEVIGACSTVPFLGSHRLVIVEGLLESLSGRGRRAGKKPADVSADLGNWQSLVDYVPSMPPSSTLLLVDGGLRSQPALADALAGKAQVRRFPALDAKGLAGWLQQRARKMGLRFEGRAATMIAQLVGDQTKPGPDAPYNELWALANELDKLAAATADGVIREEDVRELTPLMREQKGYVLWDALVEGRPEEATRLLRELQRQGDNPQATLGLIAGAYRRLVTARGLLDEGASTAAIGRAFNFKSDFPAQKLAEQASRYPLSRLRDAYRRIVAADFDHKSGLCDEDLALELLVQDLTARRRLAPVS